MMRRGLNGIVTALILVAAVAQLHAQGRGGRGGDGTPPAPPTPQASATVDLSGYWVSLVTEDWRWRMVPAAKGDVASVPVTQAARDLANAWDPAKDQAAGNQCKAYGAAGIMRMPTRIRFSWENENVLKLETDSGTQTRLFRFGAAAQSPAGERTWQGSSVAVWEPQAGGRGGRGGRGGADVAVAAVRGSLKVVTTNLKPGYLLRNGIPYGEKATVTEYFNRTPETYGVTYLIVTTIVEDPDYLTEPFITSSHFRKLPDTNNGWNPTPCVVP